jgi:succinyl-CoA synthetase alpha subunit
LQLSLKFWRLEEERPGGILFADSAEEAKETAEYVARGYPKSFVAFIAGRSVPPEKRMGHAGAIAMGNAGMAETKIKAF